ncbi:(deoxy)nucleoside triphosphate pyrophosphohydrolase [Myroides marinus]|uniref:(deoxy)nucleoside triphosphate pyrophosphohydrolase n=1 Tax=Myroides marinus TaxID=703342 RepID=UPI0025791DBC|nr:(deoxy)nucleoside triphosphate pyrophosphohydrolase [Myroides marinus]MDM1349581.1 (deoxy)nucleoside triphosphate pyrophosphohydrolase [Myroides marinus]MDM1356791.1 (deoxy)nucleoside triphosphate pyrophosphohydrolase [Myroides marinus]MDM1501174.1 (deoxy)nucleoside triphosphate pyrophosphohydrolase [Myroides marinus]MDM1532303.1 (deoxy)nucleoside triphosphate pyrophosphohydrolase [Myroides marinus]MDM1539322.1 (deoxy)nucleoside triphosphate pyrophosphohydrolase [Myroides marinus]
MLRVTCAIIEHNNKVLIAQRSQNMLLPLKWEFPGGKVEIGENDDNCIVREIKEELDLDIIIKSRLTSVVHHYDSFSLELIPFICLTDTPVFQRREHAQILWVESTELRKYDWAAADIPIVEEYLKLIGGGVE